MRSLAVLFSQTLEGVLVVGRRISLCRFSLTTPQDAVEVRGFY